MKKTPLRSQKVLKVTAWTNIVAQVFFPVATALTPAFAGASQPHVPARSWTSEALKNAQTRPYVIQSGESVKDIASRAGLTVEQLKKINQFRTFSKPFNQLTTGDEIDLPVAQANNEDNKEPPAESDNSAEQNLASASTSAAGILSSGNTVRAASDKARSYASGRLNDEITSWLSSAGTARTKLSVDNKGRLNGSELDVLIPFDDNPDAFLFTQAGIRHIDDRTTANLGIGQRHFIDDKWMFGYNGFLDYDLTRDHSRLGLGLEYGRDFLKVGTNGYFRLSDWKNSPDLRDYDERPANGFDIRGEAWLPVYPQIGGSLAYEQYFGDEVGVISKDVRGKNPAAFSAGLTYTPFPLVSLGLERKQDTNGDGNTLLNLGLNYDIGTPWLKQIDPDAVRDKRTLTGTRYDLVERNNQIVLEYRKQEVIRLKLPSLVAGLSGETKPLNIGINARYGLDYVQWDDAQFVQAGGKVYGTGGQYSVVLPPYTESGANSWTISAVAYDKKGNVSKRAETQISVTSAGISTTKSTFTSSESALPSDGESTSDLILELRDENNNPVKGLSEKIVINLSMTAGEGSEATVSSVKEVSPGRYEAVLTAGSRTGEVTLTPEVSGIALSGTTVELLSPSTPAIKSLVIKGLLETGQALSATYSFIQPDAESKLSRNSYLPSDSSKYAWGAKGTTAQSVLSGKKISVSGQIPGYTLNTADIGNIIELSVLPENSLGIDGQIITIDTSMSAENGNNTNGGDGNGTVINASARPAVSGLTLKGTLQVNKGLSATYKFEPKNGDILDRSTFAWGAKGAASGLAASSTEAVSTSGIIPEYTVKAEDAGKILEVAVQPRNGKNITGTVVSLATDATSSDGNNTSGGGDGGLIIDPTSAPSVSNLKFRGSLVSGSSLTAGYDFSPGIGIPGDKSQFAWGEEGTTASLADNGQTVSSSGVVPSRSLGSNDVGKILELSVRARNAADVKGNIVTLTTADKDNGLNGSDAGTVIDPAAAPKINDLSLSGSLVVGSALRGTYKFDANKGDRSDKSLYFWGIKGQTENQVGSSGIAVVTSGILPDETITQQYAGQVLEVSVMPKNGLGVKGTVVKMSTDAASGNNFQGGDNGQIVDSVAAPVARDLSINGQLIAGSSLSGTYTFDPNKGEPTDNSKVFWGEKGKTESAVDTQGNTVTDSGLIPPYVVKVQDAGKTLEVAVQPRNGNNISGTTVTVATDATEGNSTSDGGEGGVIIDPSSKPVVSNIKFSGTLVSGMSLNASYEFNPGLGYRGDKSLYAWGEKDTTASLVGQGSTVLTSGVVPSYTIVPSDVGKTLELSVQARNSKDVTGDVVTLNTAQQGNGLNESDGATVIDPAAAPKINNLSLSGRLEVNSPLKGTYNFDANNGDRNDTSIYLWGIKGQTESAVSTSGTPVTTSGVIPDEIIGPQYAGQILEVSVLPKNGRDVKGIVAKTSTDISSGNNFQGGDGGQIVDTTAVPAVTNLSISGQLITTRKLTASYTFDPNKGDPNDSSQFLWGEKGQTSAGVEAQGQTVTTPGSVEKTIDSTFIGKVIEVSVLPKNGLGIKGTPETIASDDSSSANTTTDGTTDGRIVDALGIPSVTDLIVSGELSVGQILSFSYTFKPNNGHITDKSYFKWGQKGSTASVVSGSGTGVTDPNAVRDYTINQADAGKVLEVSVLPHNGIGVFGTTVTTSTDMQPANTTGGNNGAVVDPAGIPKVSGLKIITDGLGPGDKISGAYTFDPDTGPVNDQSVYRWGILGNTQASVTSSTDRVVVSGLVPEYPITIADNGKVLELSVLPRNGNGANGAVATVNTVEQSGWDLITILPGSNTNYIQAASAIGASLMWLPNNAVGPFVFTNKQTFTSSTNTGVIKLAVDDTMNYLILNGKRYDTSSCGVSQVCNIPVDNLQNSGNKIAMNVYNQSGGSGMVVLSVSDANNNVLLNTSNPSLWTYYSPLSN